MSNNNKSNKGAKGVVVVLGGTGVLGSGAAHAFIADGYTVVVVSRSMDKIQAVKKTIKVDDAKDAFIGVVGAFATEKDGKATYDAVVKALNGRAIDHVISSLAFVNFRAGPSESSLAELQATMNEGLYPTFVAAKAFLPPLRDRKGSTFTVVSGGSAHFTPAPEFWQATLKNAANNALTLGLAREFEKAEVRVNAFCVYPSVAPFGVAKEMFVNQIGVPAEHCSLELGPAFVGFVKDTTLRGSITDVKSWEEAAQWSAKARQ